MLNKHYTTSMDSAQLHKAALARLCLKDSDLKEKPYSDFLSKYKDEERAQVFYQNHQKQIADLKRRVQEEESKIVAVGMSEAEYQMIGSPSSLSKYLKRGEMK